MTSHRPHRLREVAERFLERRSSGDNPSPDVDEQRLVHELRVHQVELEIQNEELRDTAQALEEAKNRYLELYDFAPVGHVTVDPKGMIRAANLTFSRMLGVDRQTLQGGALSRFVAKEDADTLWLHYRKVSSSGQRLSCEVRMIGADGQGFRARLETASLWSEERGQNEHLISVSDVTDRWEAEQALQRAKENAERANDAKSQFMCRMSHELRTPLNAILGFAQLLWSDKGRLKPDQETSVDRILEAGKRLLVLVNDVLDVNKIALGELPFSLAAVSLEMALSNAVAQVQTSAAERGVTLTETSRETHWVTADAKRLRQVLTNLLSNAVELSRSGGSVEVRVESMPDRKVRVNVCNNGLEPTPIDPAEAAEIGIQGPATSGQAGPGVVLTVTEKLVEAMGGRTGVETRGRYARSFWIELPEAQPEPAKTQRQAPAATQAGLAARQVLYVEDNPANMALVKAIFRQLPRFELLEASDAERGIEIARARIPVLILMDIQLPGMDGFEALRILQEDPATSDIPVIAVSAHAMQKELEKGLQAGFRDYITKPIQIDRLIALVEQACANGEAVSPL